MTKHLIPILILAAGSTLLAEQPNKLMASVPFNFTAGEKMFPAGDYVINKISSGNAISIRSVDHQNSAILLTNATEASRVSKAGRLLFNRTGDRYSLTEIWAPGTHSGIVVPPSKAERELRSRSDVPSRARVSVAFR